MKETEVSVAISYPSGGVFVGRSICIEVTDNRSRLRLIRIELPADQAYPLFATSTAEGTAVVTESEKVGMWMEVKQAICPPFSQEEFPAPIIDHAKQYEAEGWVVDAGSISSHNRHCRVSGGYRYSLRRWSEVKP